MSISAFPIGLNNLDDLLCASMSNGSYGGSLLLCTFRIMAKLTVLQSGTFILIDLDGDVIEVVSRALVSHNCL